MLGDLSQSLEPRVPKYFIKLCLFSERLAYGYGIWIWHMDMAYLKADAPVSEHAYITTASAW